MTASAIDFKHGSAVTETVSDVVTPPLRRLVGDTRPPGCISCRSTASRKSARTDTPSAAASPPIPLPRRMWAGSQFQFHEPVRVGDAVTRVSTIHDVTEKSGRTGPLVFVKVRHEISREGSSNVAITEFHDIVYREAAKPDDVVRRPLPLLKPPPGKRAGFPTMCCCSATRP